MNIYNNSTIGTNTYPTNATLTSLEVTDLQIDSTLTIQGSQKGGILICEDTTNDIGQVDIGLQNMVLASDKNNTGLPIWTDSVTLNTGTFNGLNLVGVNTGDLLVGSGANAIGRLPAGLNDQVLFSNGTTVGWQYLTALNNVVTFIGTTNNITSTRSVIFGNQVNVIAGRRYKVTISGKFLTSTQTLLYFTISGILTKDSLYTASGDYNVMVVVTAMNTGPLVFFVEAEVLSGGTSSLLNTTVTVEEF